MRTAQFLLVGGLLLAAALLLGRLFEAEFPQARLAARAAFTAVWAGLTLFSLWVGVARAGYGLAEEAPIHLALFGLPAAAAWLLRG